MKAPRRRPRFVLRPCPFCGAGERHLIVLVNCTPDVDHGFCVECTKCHAQGPTVPGRTDDLVGRLAWNKRAG